MIFAKNKNKNPIKLIFPTVFILLCAFNCFSQSINIDQRLTEIAQMNDKTLSIQAYQALLETPMPVKQQVLIYKLITQNQINLGDNLAAQKSALLMINLADEHHLDLELAQANKLEAITHYYLGNYEKAISGYQASLVYFRLSQEYIQQANLLNNIGLVQVRIGEHDDALETYKEAKIIYQNYGSEDDLYDIKRNIAGIYINLRKYDLAITQYQELLEWHLVNSDQAELMEIYAEYAVPLKQAQQFEKAEEYGLKVVEYHRTSGNNYSLASALHNLSEIYNELAEYKKAQIYAQQAVEVSEGVSHQKALSGALYSLAKSLFSQGNTEQALVHLTRAHEISENNKDKSLSVAIDWLYAMIFAYRQDVENTLFFHQKAIKNQYELSNERLNVKLARYQSSQLSQQVAQLKQSQQLQDLKAKQNSQYWIFVTIGLLLFGLVTFFLYSRNIERHSKIELREKLKQRASKIDQLNEELTETIKLKRATLKQLSDNIREPLNEVDEQIMHLRQSSGLSETNQENLNSIQLKLAKIQDRLV